MPATRIQVFRDPAPALASDAPTPRRATARRASASVIGNGTPSGVQTRAHTRSTTLVGTSLITTAVSTVTIESGDKENRDPITGLPLALLLANSKPGSKGKLNVTPGQKYIATTITTTVLSPVPAPTAAPVKKGLSLKAGANAGAGAGKRVALGAVKKTNEVPYSLADADTDDEDVPVKKAKSAKTSRPRRSLRLAASPLDASAPTSASVSTATATAPASTSTTTTVKAAKKSATSATAGVSSGKTKTKRARTSDDPTVAAEPATKTKTKSAATSTQAKARREALVRHTAAVVGALDVDGSASTEMDVDAIEGEASPAKKRRTSPRKAQSLSLSGSATVSGGVRATEVFSPVRVSPRHAATAAADDAMDVDNDTADCIQRIIDARCRDLTVLPLANVSDAYSVTGSVSASVATSRAGSVFD